MLPLPGPYRSDMSVTKFNDKHNFVEIAFFSHREREITGLDCPKNIIFVIFQLEEE